MDNEQLTYLGTVFALIAGILEFLKGLFGSDGFLKALPEVADIKNN